MYKASYAVHLTQTVCLSTVICHNHTHGLIVLKKTNEQTQEYGEEEEEEEEAAAKNRIVIDDTNNRFLSLSPEVGKKRYKNK